MNRPYAIAIAQYNNEDAPVTTYLNSSAEVEEYIDNIEHPDNQARTYAVYVLTMARVGQKVWTPEEVLEHALVP